MCLLAPHFREMTKTEKYSVQRVLMPPKMALLPLPFRAKEFQLVYSHLSGTSFRVFAKIVENSIIILFAILVNNLIIHRAIKIRTFAISQSCAASFKAKSSKPIRVRTG